MELKIALVEMPVVASMGMAMIIVMLAVLAPITLPKERMGFFSSAEVTPTIISGKDVASATSRKLMVYSEIPKWRASLDADSMKTFTDLTKTYEAASIRIKVTAVGIVTMINDRREFSKPKFGLRFIFCFLPLVPNNMLAFTYG